MTNLEKYYDEIKEFLQAQDWGTTCALNDCLNSITKRQVFCTDTPSRICERRTDCLLHNLAWLKEEYKEPLLTKYEKEFLKSFIEFFGCDEETIIKRSNDAFDTYLIIIRGCDEKTFTLWLDSKKRFSKLEVDKAYTLEELGLDE